MNLTTDDLCKIIESICVKNRTGILQLAEANAHSLSAFYHCIANSLGKKTIFVTMPVSIALLIAQMAELIRIPFPIRSESVLGLKHLKSFETQKDLDSFDFKIKTMEESISQLNSNT